MEWVPAALAIASGLIGLAFAALSIWLFFAEKAAADRVKTKTETVADQVGVAGVDIGEQAKGLAELANALKDLSRSLQAAFMAALFFLIATAAAVGDAATDAADDTPAKNGEPAAEAGQ